MYFQTDVFHLKYSALSKQKYKHKSNINNNFDRQFDSNEREKKVKSIKKEARTTKLYFGCVAFSFMLVGLIHTVEWNMELNSNTLNRSLTNSQIYDGEFFEVVATEGDILVVR